MKIGDQIRAKRTQSGMAVAALAQQVGVSEQAVRYWESGRSDPSKEVARKVEAALGFRLDWTEGVHRAGPGSSTDALIPAQDIDLLLLIGQLPYEAKLALGQLVRLFVQAQTRGGARGELREREAAPAARPFSEKPHAKNQKAGRR